MKEYACVDLVLCDRGPRPARFDGRFGSKDPAGADLPDLHAW